MNRAALRKIERAVRDLAGACQTCAATPRWVVVAEAGTAPKVKPCPTCGSTEVVTIIHGVHRLPGDSR